jgi:hypothetical protein
VSFLTAVAWLAFVALAALFVLLAVQQHRWADREQLARSLGIASAVTGSLLGWALAVGARADTGALIAGIAVGVVGLFMALWRIRQDVKAGKDRTVGASIAAAAVAMIAALKDARAKAQAKRQARADGKQPDAGSLRALRSVPPPEPAARTSSGVRRAAPPPALPPADGPAPPPARQRFATITAVIPPDHAAAQQRIAEFEPVGLPEHIDFMTREARGFAGYGEAFAAYADGLIHGPGVHPAALRTTFEFADGFHEVAAGLHLAVKRTVDYFREHLEWAETHDPTKDGHWTIRE